MILLIFLTLGFAITAMTLSEIKIADNHTKSTQAFYLAEAGIAEAVNVLFFNPTVKGVIVNKLPLASGEVTVKGSWSGNIITLEAVGKVGGAKRTVKQKLRVEGSSVFDNAITTFADTTEDLCVFSNNVEINGDLAIGILTEIYQNVKVNGNFYTDKEPLINESFIAIKTAEQLNLLNFPPIPKWEKAQDLDQPYEYGNVTDVKDFRTGYKSYLAENVELENSMELNDVYIECASLNLRGKKYSGVTFAVDGPIKITSNNSVFENVNLIAKDFIKIEGSNLVFRDGRIITDGYLDASKSNNSSYYDVQIFSADKVLLSNNITVKPGIIMSAKDVYLENYFELEGYLLAKGKLTAKNNVDITGSVGVGGLIFDNKVRITHSKDIDVPMPSTVPTGVKITKLRWSEGQKPI